MLLALTALFAQTTFEMEAPAATKVQFASDHEGWSRPVAMGREGHFWSHKIDLPADARIEYQFIVDGKWQLDPKNPKKSNNGVGGFNSVWEGSDYRNTANVAMPKKPMDRRELNISSLTPKRKVSIFIPKTNRRSLPLLIYADGAEYENRLMAPVILENLIEVGEIEPCVLLLISPVDRMKDYWKESAPYEQTVVTKLIPEIREMYPVVSRRAEDVYVGGASLGGLISFRLAQNYPDVIAGGVHSQSGAFQVDGSVMAGSSLRKIAPGAKIALDWGAYEGELTDANEKMAKALDGRKVKKVFSNEGHNWVAWQNRFTEGVKFLLGVRKR